MNQIPQKKAPDRIALFINILYLLFSLLFAYIGLQMTLSYLLPDTIAPSDLVEVKGKLASAGIETSKTKTQDIYNYIIRIQDNKRVFRIYESPLKYFPYREFERETGKSGVVILKFFKNDSSSGDNTEIVELKAHGKTWLSLDDYSKSYRENRIFIFIAGAIMIIFGLIFIKGSWGQIRKDIA